MTRSTRSPRTVALAATVVVATAASATKRFDELEIPSDPSKGETHVE